MELSSNILLLFQIYLFIYLLTFVSDVFHFKLIIKILNEEVQSESILKLTVIRQIILRILRGLTQIFLIVYFLRWFYYSYKLLSLTEHGNFLNYKASTSFWSWFIPVANLIIPYQIMQELFGEYQQAAGFSDRNSKIVGWWWLLFLISIIAGFFQTNINMANSIDNIEVFSGELPEIIIPQLLELASIISAIILTRKLKKYIYAAVDA